MRKILLILGFVLSAGFVFAQNYQVKELSKSLKQVSKHSKALESSRGTAINNSDFETWVGPNYGLGEWPDGYTMLTGNPGAQKLTGADVQSGSYAIHCESDTTTNAAMQWTDTLVGGMALTADLVVGVFGEPYTQRPDSMTFHIKGSLNGNDTAIVVMQLMQTGSLVGSAGVYLGGGDITTNYQEITIPFNYENTNTPDSAMIIISSSGVGVFQGGDIGTLTAGSFIDVDNMSFIDNPTGISENKDSKIAVYPNPASDVVFVRNAQNADINIVNMVGQVVLSKTANNKQETINISELPEGTYIIRVEKENEVSVKKLNILK